MKPAELLKNICKIKKHLMDKEWMLHETASSRLETAWQNDNAEMQSLIWIWENMTKDMEVHQVWELIERRDNND